MPSTIAPPTEQQEPTLRDVLNAVNGLGTEVGELRTEVGGLRTEVGGLQTEVGGLRTEVGGLRTEVGGLQTEVGGLRTEVGSLGTRIDSLKADIYEAAKETAEHIVSAISEVRVELGAKLAESDSTMRELSQDVVRVKVDMSELRADNEQIKHVMYRNHNEAMTSAEGNRTALRGLKYDIVSLTEAVVKHAEDGEIHLPRPRTMPVPDAGPIAA